MLSCFCLTQCKTKQADTLLNQEYEQKLLSDKSSQSIFDVQTIFEDQRFPNIVVAMDGSLVCSWGTENVLVKRSEDGGLSWSKDIFVTKGIQGGGMIVDELSGDILLFTEDSHPVAKGHMFRSKNNGISWKEEALLIKPNSLGHIPSLHMNEHGICLLHGKYKGRLIRATRYYDGGNDKQYWDNHYTNALYSDDHGKSWQASEPFPIFGTGEAAIVELSDGELYYNTRRHKSTDGLTPRKRYEGWSIDGGQTWTDTKLVADLPDGSQHRDYGLMGGLTKMRNNDGDVLLFSNIVSEEGRKNGTIWLSLDQAKSWPLQKTIDAGSFAYSSLVFGRKGTSTEGFVFLFYESNGGGKIARFNLSWLLMEAE